MVKVTSCRDRHSDSPEERINTISMHLVTKAKWGSLYDLGSPKLWRHPFFSFTLESPLFWIKPTVNRFDHMLPAITAKNVGKVGGARCNLFLKDQHFLLLSPVL